MVLLLTHGAMPENIHSDLSRVPPFVCTALVHMLREAITLEIDQVGPGLIPTMRVYPQ